MPEAKPVRVLLTYHKGLSRFFRRTFPTPMQGDPGPNMIEIIKYLDSGDNRKILLCLAIIIINVARKVGLMIHIAGHLFKMP